MRTTSLVDAKTHLSELVDLAEHKKQRIIICRHGKPAAAIVPVEVAHMPLEHVRNTMSLKDARKLLRRIASYSNSGVDPMNDLYASRSRFDRSLNERAKERAKEP